MEWIGIDSGRIFHVVPLILDGTLIGKNWLPLREQILS